MAIRCPTIVVAVILILLIMTAFWLFHGFGLVEAEEESRYRVIEIKGGDSLWELARKHRKPNRDLRETIDVIRDVNGLKDSRLLPGQQLKVPID